MIASMHCSISLLLLTLTGLASAHPTWERRAVDPQTSLTLDPSQIQTGFKQDGSNGTGAEPGQSKSKTSSNNFINFCLTQKVPLMNGQQIQDGACSATPMGRIVGKKQMPSAKFVFPPNGHTALQPNKNFTVQLKVNNLQTGTFVNANTNYLAAPQEVNAQGIVIGHTHLVIESIPSLGSTEPTNPQVFAFFKGINGVADKNGILEVVVDKGLPAGFYRMTSMNAAANHQPVLVTIAQRGALDDSVYFTVGGGGSGNAASSKTDAATTTAKAKTASTTANAQATGKLPGNVKQLAVGKNSTKCNAQGTGNVKRQTAGKKVKKCKA